MTNPSRPGRHSIETQALGAVRDAIARHDTHSLQELAARRLPAGWPEKFRDQIGPMAVAAAGFLRDGDRNTRTGFNGFAAANSAPIVSTPGAAGYRSIVDTMFAERDSAPPADSEQTVQLHAPAHDIDATQRTPVYRMPNVAGATSLDATAVLTPAQIKAGAMNHRYYAPGAEQTAVLPAQQFPNGVQTFHY